MEKCVPIYSAAVTQADAVTKDSYIPPPIGGKSGGERG